jgi:hypothetical protein
MREAAYGSKEGQAVWVEDGDGKQHPAIFVGEPERQVAWWRTVRPRRGPGDRRRAVVQIFRLTPSDE